MIKTKADLDSQRQKLFAKHPALADLTVKSAADYPKSHKVNDYDWLAAFIDMCWRHTYHAHNSAKKSRFIYTANYLEWLLYAPWIDKKLTTIISDKDGHILGITYGINKTLSIDGDNLKIAVRSGLSIHPKYSKMGVLPGNYTLQAAKTGKEFTSDGAGQTIIKGSLTISSGIVEIDGLVIGGNNCHLN